MWVNLKRDGPFGPKKVPGRVRIALTYKSYVDEEEEGADEKEGSFSPYIKVYGDSGAESVEDIGVSLGEAVEASLMEEAKRKGVTMTDHEDEFPEIPIVSTPREDSSVEVSNASSSTASNGNARSTNGAAVPSRHTNGAPAASRQKVDASRHGNGAASSRHDSRHSNGAAVRRDDATEESYPYPSRSFGDNGDTVRVWPRSGEQGGDVHHKELESLMRRSGSGAHEEGAADPHSIPSGWKRSSSSHPSSRPDHRHTNKEFLFETSEADDESETTTSEEPEGIKPDGNKLLWLCMFTTVAYIIGCSLHLSNPLHP